MRFFVEYDTLLDVLLCIAVQILRDTVYAELCAAAVPLTVVAKTTMKALKSAMHASRAPVKRHKQAF
jgi:hypothetical protein